MELYKELLINALDSQRIEVTFPELKIDAKTIVELKSYDALRQIKQVIEDDSLKDDACFERIERIVCIFERTCGSLSSRHDF